MSVKHKSLLIICVAIVVILIGVFYAAQGIDLADRKDEPLLAAHFIGWYGYDQVTGDCRGGQGSMHWNDGLPGYGVVHRPYIGFYCSADMATIHWQIDGLQEAGINVLLFSWWGWGDADLNGVNEENPARYINRGLFALLDFLRDTGSPIKVAVIVEPFMLTEGRINPNELTDWQEQLILDWLWENVYSTYSDQMVKWDGNPLLVDFAPLKLTDDPRYTIRHWAPGPKTIVAVSEGWQWFFTHGQPVAERISDDGVVFIGPRFDNYYRWVMSPGVQWLPVRVDPLLVEGLYETEWKAVIRNRDDISMVVIYSWNEYNELAQIEPSGGAHAPVEREYVEKTRRYYEKLLKR